MVINLRISEIRYGRCNLPLLKPDRSFKALNVNNGNIIFSLYTVKPGKCPKPGFGICINRCNSDSDCSGTLKCCSNGCGRTCQRPCPLIRCLPVDCSRHGGPKYFRGCRGCGCGKCVLLLVTRSNEMNCYILKHYL